MYVLLSAHNKLKSTITHMKSIIYLGMLSLLFMSCNEAVESKNDEKSEVEKVNYTVYGEEINSDGVVAYDELMTSLQTNDTVMVKLEGEIDRTCQVKGCWMKVNVKEGEDPLHVTFKDYGFFVPKEGMESKAAIFEGIAFVDTISVNMLRHYAEDDGKSPEEIEAINEPEVVLTFEASGVLIDQ